MTHSPTMLNGLQAGRRLICAAAAASLMSASSVFAQDGDISGLVNRYAGGIASVEVAERALADVHKERSGIEARFAADERACYTEFFANSCVENAKERRRAALVEVRKVEVDANAFLRQARVNERDRALEEKRVAQERKQAERLKQEQAAGPAKQKKTHMREPAREPAPASASPIDTREARHEAKLKRLEAQDRADAQKRADKVAAYERKVREAQERQRQVEERKREKERERASRSPLN